MRNVFALEGFVHLGAGIIRISVPFPFPFPFPLPESRRGCRALNRCGVQQPSRLSGNRNGNGEN